MKQQTHISLRDTKAEEHRASVAKLKLLEFKVYILLWSEESANSGTIQLPCQLLQLCFNQEVKTDEAWTAAQNID